METQKKTLGQPFRLHSFDEQEIQPRTVTVLLLAFFLIGILLRLVNLGEFPLYSDEDNHTHVAIQLLNGVPVDYFRGFFPVSLPVFLSFKLFGISIFAARLPMILLNMLAIFPLYKLTARLNQLIGLLAVFLFITNPWVITAARTAREYSVLPLLFFVTSNLLIDLLDVENLSPRAYFAEKKAKVFFALAILVYVIFIDPRSWFTLALLSYLIFFGLIFLDLARRPQYRTRLIIAAVVLASVFIGIVFQTLRSQKMTDFSKSPFSLVPKFESLQTIIADPFANSYWLPQIGYLILAFVLLLLVVSLPTFSEKKSRVILFNVIAFIGVTVFFVFIFFNAYVQFRFRYGILLVYFIIPCVAIFIYSVSRLIKPKNTALSTMIPLTLLTAVFFVNIPSIQAIYNYQGKGRHPVSGNAHYRYGSAYEYLASKILPGEALLSNSFYYVDEMNGNRLQNPQRIEFNTVFREERKSIKQAVNAYKTGWVAVYPDTLLEKLGFENGDFVVGDKSFEYHGRIDDVYLWHWKTINY